MIEAKVICDSITSDGKRITSVQVKYHRFVLPEANTHRKFSRSYSSSRAIPFKTLLDQVLTDLAYPVFWGINQPGMQAFTEMDEATAIKCRAIWEEAANAAVGYAQQLADLGLHKQTVNRVIEPYLWVRGIITSTDWDNFFALRDHKDAQPEIRALAVAIKEAIDKSTPKALSVNQWHLPYITEDDLEAFAEYGDDAMFVAAQCSAARCARVSYMKHDGTKTSIEDDLELFSQLVVRPYTDKRGNHMNEDDPIHASPCEHQATPDRIFGSEWANRELHGNFDGWIQFRKMIEARR